MNENYPKFTILASLYDKEKPEYLEQAFQSIADQSLKADEFVLVFDGQINCELEIVVQRWKELLQIKIVKLEENLGLGMALNQGILHCKHELIVRVDTDDINLPDRFAQQVKFMVDNPNISVSSGYIAEFYEMDFDNIITYRKVPKMISTSIIQLGNPINHPASIFRKSDILAVGNYQDFKYMEDYYLWLRLFLNGYHLENIEQVILLFRSNSNMIARRSGLSYLKSEKKMYHFLKEKFNLSLKVKLRWNLRMIARLLPVWCLRIIYRSYRNM